MSEQKPPLWEVMQRAAALAPQDVPTISAELRALRDWLVPEELEPPSGDGEPWPQSYQQRSDAMWEQRQLLRTLLTTEADGAEAGK